MTRSPRRASTTAFAVCASLFLAACGGEEDPGETRGASESTTVGQEAPTGAPSTPSHETSAAPSTEDPESSAPDPSSSAPDGTPSESAPEAGETSVPAEPSEEAPTDTAPPSATVAPPGPEPTEPAPETTTPAPGATDPTPVPTEPAPTASDPAPSPTPSGTATEPTPSPSEPSEPSEPSSPAPGGWSDWVSFGSAPEQRYMMLPGEPGKDVVVLIHGGGWVGGKAEAFADEENRKNNLVKRLESMGLWVASVEYRKADESPWPATPQDVHAGVTAAVAEARSKGAGEGVGLFGDSAGGHLAAFEAIKHPGTVDAVVGYYGIYDPLTAKAQRKDLSCPPKTAAEDHIYMQDATDPALKAQVEQASPVAQVTSAAPPMFLLHGTIDCVAPASQSQQMHEALLAQGVQSKLVMVPGADHSQPAFWTEDEYLSQVTSWMAVHGVD
ncbi:alpha/beta hydrolase fold domain-containing protein [Kytococcus sedentarius]|uniref:alpha/beta hydrolase fold domain-containing protein n=1 Tax=Kytococcus sedentarius TaxID=1276 RepID=UPI0035BC448E